MEMGSRSSAGSNSSKAASSPADHSVDGLKFGKKIYFEDGGIGTQPKPGAGAGTSSRKIQSGQQHPPRCQVEGCKVDLSDAKAYYSKHRVCGMHSKSPTVIVAGLEQRFCQQCSRFHQLPEFDQGKRSCRRRLAGHNERRRKPTPGSLLSSPYGRLSSTIFDNTSSRGFLLDFGAYPRLTGRDAWPGARVSEQIAGNQNTAPGRSVPPWQNSSQNLPSNLFLQTSCSSRTAFPSSEIPPGECFTGVTVADSSCALSLLSNQSWGSRNGESGLGMENVLNTEGPPVAQSTCPHGASLNQFTNPSWSFKGNHSDSTNSHQMCPDLGLTQIPQTLSIQLSSELELSQQNRRQYMELDHSGAYDSSTHHTHWSL
uniref:Squamosa promoter binding protein-like 9 n=1 Tax=Passiflora edulis var. edulis TaxID=1735966 RepID=A0A482F940_PASED|nr:squamosa promoter binding protein-like 9 [Passiflora edulis var. edulis]